MDGCVVLYKRRLNGLGGEQGSRVLYQNLNLNLNMNRDRLWKGLHTLCL